MSSMMIEEVSLRHHTLINMRCLQSHFWYGGSKHHSWHRSKELPKNFHLDIWCAFVVRYIRFSHPGRNTQSKLICNLFPHCGTWTPFQVLKALVHTVVPHPPAHHFWHHVGFKLLHRTPADLYLDPNLLFIYLLQFSLVKLGCWWMNSWENFSRICITFCA